MTKKFIVTVKLPPGATIREVQQYIKEACEAWGGQRHPDDPLFSMWDRITVKPIKETSK